MGATSVAASGADRSKSGATADLGRVRLAALEDASSAGRDLRPGIGTLHVVATAVRVGGVIEAHGAGFPAMEQICLLSNPKNGSPGPGEL